LNLGAFNGIFGFPVSLDLRWRCVPQEFNLNAFWYEIMWDYRYNTSTRKCTFIRNPCIQVAQWMLACGIFARDDTLNVSRLSELYFLSYMINGGRSDLDHSWPPIYSAATSIEHKIVSRILTTQVRMPHYLYTL